MIKKDNTLAIISLALGLLFWIPLLNILFSIGAIIVGMKSIGRINDRPDECGGKPMAIAGIALGSLTLLLSLYGLLLARLLAR